MRARWVLDRMHFRKAFSRWVGGTQIDPSLYPGKPEISLCPARMSNVIPFGKSALWDADKAFVFSAERAARFFLGEGESYWGLTG